MVTVLPLATVNSFFELVDADARKMTLVVVVAVPEADVSLPPEEPEPIERYVPIT